MSSQDAIDALNRDEDRRDREQEKIYRIRHSATMQHGPHAVHRLGIQADWADQDALDAARVEDYERARHRKHHANRLRTVIKLIADPPAPA